MSHAENPYSAPIEAELVTDTPAKKQPLLFPFLLASVAALAMQGTLLVVTGRWLLFNGTWMVFLLVLAICWALSFCAQLLRYIIHGHK